MKLLLRQVYIADKNSPHNGQVNDILISSGVIEQIQPAITAPEATVIENDELIVSPGWIDIFSHFNDPGFEHKETLESGAAAAAAGGFTTIFTLPNTLPVTDTKSAVEYIVNKSRQLPVDIYPLGAVSKKTEGKELAEIYDMRNSGAIAFTDGLMPVQNAGLLLKALQYVKAIDGIIIQMPVDDTIGKGGLMNEGIMSTRLGLPGIPAIGEELMITRDIKLAEYTDSRLHITGVSTAKGIELIKNAKSRGIQVTCSTTTHHLAFCDEDLATYDTNLKTNPPLRTREDMMALRTAVTQGFIDCIATHHLPQDWDCKTAEFEYAKAGMIGLETTFSIINQLFPAISTNRLVDLLSNNARELFFAEKNIIQQGNKPNMTIFSRKGEWVYTGEEIKSKSRNSPFINKKLKGKVIGIINKDKVYLNH